MKTYEGVDLQTHVFLTSALVGGEWSVSRPGRFTPGEKAPSTHWIGGWVGMEKWKFLSPPRLELRSSVVQSVASRYTDYGIPALEVNILITEDFIFVYSQGYVLM
jgi:hypothetical protein